MEHSFLGRWPQRLQLHKDCCCIFRIYTRLQVNSCQLLCTWLVGPWQEKRSVSMEIIPIQCCSEDADLPWCPAFRYKKRMTWQPFVKWPLSSHVSHLFILWMVSAHHTKWIRLNASVMNNSTICCHLIRLKSTVNVRCLPCTQVNEVRRKHLMFSCKWWSLATPTTRPSMASFPAPWETLPMLLDVPTSL